MAKLHKLHFELLPHPPYSPDLDPTNYYPFAYLQGMLQGKVIVETEPYFEAKDKLFYKNGIELLEKR